MLFNSLHFVLFFPIVIAIYFLLGRKARTIWLLLASYYFYMSWKPEYATVILGSTIIDYFTARKIASSSSKKIRKRWLSLSILVNLGILFSFKYLDFFGQSANEIFEAISIDFSFDKIGLIPLVGISFYTFQTMSYSIDVYRGTIKPERNFLRFALYVSFFPQLVAGPIERAKHLLPQFQNKYEFQYERIVSGLRKMLWGFFQKVVIADQLARVVNQVYNNPQDQSGLTYLVGSFFFAFQIYCDFAGYSNIAIGAARVMGYDLMENFRQPYQSKSIREFWTRWHISLSSWFKDYVYIPLGGNRRVKWRWYFNLIITFLVSGLWHGANWTYVVWGAYHGTLLVIGIQIAKVLKSPRHIFDKILRITAVFILTNIGWVFFRAKSMNQALDIFKKFIGIPNELSEMIQGIPKLTGLGSYDLQFIGYLICLVFGLYMIELIRGNSRVKEWYYRHSIVRFTSYCVLFYWIVFGGYFGETSFIYFQF